MLNNLIWGLRGIISLPGIKDSGMVQMGSGAADGKVVTLDKGRPELGGSPSFLLENNCDWSQRHLHFLSRDARQRKVCSRDRSLERLVRKEPLRRTHECVFGFLPWRVNPLIPGSSPWINGFRSIDGGRSEDPQPHVPKLYLR